MKSRHSYRVYKASRKITGAAFQLNVGEDNSFALIEIGKQIGWVPTKYDWDNKFIFKITSVDALTMMWALLPLLDKVYNYIVRSKDQDEFNRFKGDFSSGGQLFNLIHKNPKNGSIACLNASLNDIKWGGGIYIKANRSLNSEQLNNVGVALSPSETLGLYEVLRKFISL